MDSHRLILTRIEVLLPLHSRVAFLQTDTLRLIRGNGPSYPEDASWWIEIEGISSFSDTYVSTNSYPLQQLDREVEEILDGLPVVLGMKPVLEGLDRAFAPLHRDWAFGRQGQISWFQAPLEAYRQDGIEGLSNHDLLRLGRDETSIRLTYSPTSPGDQK